MLLSFCSFKRNSEKRSDYNETDFFSFLNIIDLTHECMLGLSRYFFLEKLGPLTMIATVELL